MNLNEYEKKEAERLFNLRRRIYDHRNIKDWPDDSKDKYDYDIEIEGYEVRAKDLSDQDKFALVVITNDLRDYGTNRRHFDVFGWKPSYVSKLAKNEKAIRCDTLRNFDEGYIAGRGYVITGIIRSAMTEMYEDHLWNDLPFNRTYMRFGTLLKVDIPNVYQGNVHMFSSGDEEGVEICYPRYSLYKDIPNWERTEKGWPKDVIRISWDCVKQWRVN